MPKHENIPDIRKSLTEENISENKKPDKCLAVCLCIVSLGIIGSISYIVNNILFVEDGSL